MVPSYNHEKFIQDCIRSIIAQDYENIELIIIDDGSKDRSVEKIIELVDACRDRFFRFEFISRPNKGLCATLNEGLNWSEGKYFVAIASDDAMKTNRIRRQIDIFNFHSRKIQNLHAVFSAYTLINENGEAIGNITYDEDIILTYKTYFGRRWLPAPTAMIAIDAIRKCGGYNEKVIFEDLDAWLNLLRAGGTFFVSRENLSFYRKHGASLSANRRKIYFGTLRIYRSHFKNPMFIPVIVKATYDYLVGHIREK